MEKESITRIFAEWLGRTRERGIPEQILQAAQDYVLDWLGCQLAGGSTETGKIFLDFGRSRPDGRAHIPGSGLCRTAETAAFVNGALSHIVEMDDLDRGSVVHPGAALIPAALAVAEEENASGRRFLEAVVAGYEMAIRLGEAVGKRHYYYFHNTATCGVFGAAVAAGWLLNLTPQQFVWALGSAGTQAAGLWQFNLEGAMSKPLHAGLSNRNGLLAARLAGLGLTGARQILEGPQGFFAGLAPEGQPDKVLAGLDDPATGFKITGVSLKPYPSCRHTHPAIDAALDLHPQVDLLGLQEIRIETYQAAIDLCENPDPNTTYAAKFSLPYCVAAALWRGRLTLADFDPQALADPHVRALLPKVTLKVNPLFEERYPSRWSTEVLLIFADGTRFTEMVDQAKGDPNNPLSKSELVAKFGQLGRYGGREEDIETWLAWVEALNDERPLTFPAET